MPTKPKIKKLAASSKDIVNAIRNSASTNYRDYVPVLEDAEDVKEIGNIIMQFPALQNEFITSLIDRIGRVIVTSKMYTNPLSVFMRGEMSTGESIEEIFVNIAEPYEYDPDKAETNLFKRVLPDVRAAFHVLNYQKFYKNTISQEQLRQAFTSLDGVTDLIARIVDAMYTSAAYDQYVTTLYLIDKRALNGQLYPVFTGAEKDGVTDYTSIIKNARNISNRFTFLSSAFNLAGVYNSCPRDDQYIFIDAATDAAVSVDVLAKAFNMTETEFLGHEIIVDSFVPDTNRLNKIFTDQDGKYIAGYQPLTAEEITSLGDVGSILVDRDFFMIFDNLNQFAENYNGESLSWQYFYHTWKTFSTSPFANAAAILKTSAGAIDSVTITPEAAEARAGQSIQFTASVTGNTFVSHAVNWSVSDPDNAKITSSGLLTLGGSATDTITVTATSVYDPTKTAEATVTVQA